MMLGMLAGHGDVESDADDVNGLVDQAQTEPGDARDVALHPPSSFGHSHGAHIQPLLVASHS